METLAMSKNPTIHQKTRLHTAIRREEKVYTTWDTVRQFDLFGKSIGLNYKGHAHYRTSGGTILSVIASLFLIYIALLCMTRLYDDYNPVFTQFTELLPADSDEAHINIFKKGFEIAFSLSGPSGKLELDPSAGHL